MIKKFILMMLAFGTCSINSAAQAKRQQTTTRSTQQRGQVMKFKQVAEDGYVWYKLKRGNFYGVRDSEGKDIIPIKYDEVNYYCGETHWFRVKKGKFQGAYTRQGTLVVSSDKHYVSVDLGNEGGKIFWRAKKEGDVRQIVLDAKGNEIFILDCDYLYMTSAFGGNSNRTNINYFQIFKNDKKGICDLNGKIICPPTYEWCVLDDYGKILKKEKDGIRLPNETINYSNSTHNNYLPYEDLYYVSKTSYSSTTNDASYSSSSSSSTNNSGNNTTTVVVEHHRDPIPVQEWQQCPACYGSGQCPNVQCGGSGWYYIGDRRSLCSRCHGSGKCTTCAGRGGQNVTVYR